MKVKNPKKVKKVMKIKAGDEARCIDHMERTWDEWCDHLLDEYKDYKSTEESYRILNRKTGRLGLKILCRVVFPCCWSWGVCLNNCFLEFT